MKKNIYSVPDVDQLKTGLHLKGLRQLYNYTVKDIAIFAGISDKSVYAWENGTSLPSLSNLIGLQSLYNLNHLEELLVYA